MLKKTTVKPGSTQCDILVFGGKGLSHSSLSVQAVSDSQKLDPKTAMPTEP